MKHTSRQLRAFLLAAVSLGLGLNAGLSGQAQQAPSVQRDFTKELANKMRGSYVVAATGSVLMQELTGRQASPAIQRILREANTAVGQLEFYPGERPPFPVTASPRELAQDRVDLGFDLIGAGDGPGTDASTRASFDALTQLGLPLAQSNRQPVFQYLASGRAALINAPNPVRLSTVKYVTAEQLAQLKGIRDAIVARKDDPDVARPVGVPEDLPDRVTIFSDTYVLGPVTGEIREEISAEDRQANLMAVRHTKQYADFVTLSMPPPPAPKPSHVSTVRRPHDAVVSMAHDLVDNGMDMYVGYGNHVIQGIEIYKGRPIFYNLGDLSAHRGAAASGGSLTALIASATYQDGILQEVRVYPVDLGADPVSRPASTVGIPMTPSADVANRVLSDLQRQSEPFGTRLVVENGVGIIRVPREATVSIGQNIRDFGTFPTGGGGGRGRGGRGGRGGGGN